MYANIYEKSGKVGIEVANSREVIVPWQDFDSLPGEMSLSDVLLMLGFTKVGTWSHRNKTSRVLVRQIGT